MNPIEQLKAQLEARAQAASFSLDHGDGLDAGWLLDCRHKSRLVVVQWRPKQPHCFAISDDDNEGMNSPDAIAESVDDAARQTLAFLGLTNPPRVRVKIWKSTKTTAKATTQTRGGRSSETRSTSQGRTSKVG